jgi:glycosyltransferase involved in cell wall biosynthesis
LVESQWSISLTAKAEPKLLILNQMAGPMTWELAEDLGKELGCVAVFTGHPDTLAKGSTDSLLLFPAPPYQRGSFTRRALSWLHYTVLAFFWLCRWPARTPLLLFSNPPILCWLGMLMKLLRRQRYAVMVHDIYPDVLVRLNGFSEIHPLIRLWRGLNRLAYNQAAVVMTLGEYMAANLEKQFDPAATPAGKVEIVYPWVDTVRIKPIPKEENWFAQKYDQVGKLTVMYSGNMGFGHDVETMLEVVKQFQNNQYNVFFMFIGAGPKWQLIHDVIAKENLENVVLLPWQKEEHIPYSLACADLSFVSIEEGISGLAIPSKGIYHLASGSGIITLSNNRNELVNWVINGFCGNVGTTAKTIFSIIVGYLDNTSAMAKVKNNSRKIAQESFCRIDKTKQVFSLVSMFLLLQATGHDN